MVHVYTFCEKTLIGKKENKTATTLCTNLFKLNFTIAEVSVFPSNFCFDNLVFKNKDMYFLLVQRTSEKLNNHLANYTNSDIEPNETLKQSVTDFYSRKNIPMDKDAEKEWLIPKSALPITNPNGKTQGYIIETEGTTIFVLPNEYTEFEKIYYDCLSSYLEEKFPTDYISETYKTFGLSEDMLHNLLKDQIKNKDKVSVSIFSRGLDNDIIIKTKKTNENFARYRQIIFDKLEKYIYAVQPISMDDYLESLIKDNNARIIFVGDISLNGLTTNLNAETLTRFVDSIIQLPNVSAKITFGIDVQQIKEFGEASAEVAYSLAVKALEKSHNCDLVLSTLVKFEDNKGVAYIALGNKTKIDIYKNRFFGSRQEILNNITQTAKFYLIKKLKSRDYKTI